MAARENEGTPAKPQELSPEQKARLARREDEAKKKLARWVASTKGTEGSDPAVRPRLHLMPEEKKSKKGLIFLGLAVLVVVGWFAAHGWRF